MSWVVDSGASFHITSHRECFNSYTSGVTGQVRMGNCGSSTIVDKGTICIETNTSSSCGTASASSSLTPLAVNMEVDAKPEFA
jgi:hypothetical protein